MPVSGNIGNLGAGANKAKNVGMSDIIEQRDGRTGRFLAGNSGNGGRKPGLKNRLGESFVAVIAHDFSLHGEGVIERVRVEQPAIWLKIVSDLLPKEAEAKIAGAGSTIFHACDSVDEIIEVLLDDIGDDPHETLAFLDTVRAAILKRAADRARPVE
jgi:hypothetical protein